MNAPSSRSTLPGFSEPIAREGGAVDVIASPIDSPHHRLLRISATGEVLGVRPYRTPAGATATTRWMPRASSTHWYMIEDVAEPQIRSFRLTP